MKNIILTFIVCTLTVGCNDNSNKKTMLGLFKKKDKIETFWTWFTDNQKKFEKIDSINRDEKLDLILANIHNITPNLSVEISDEFKGIRDLVISPEGDKEKFAIVKEIIDRAPTIKGWTFTAFRQHVDEDFTLEYKDIKFTPSKMFFLPKVDGDSLDLIIYAKNIANRDFNTIAHYGLITMDNVLGEYDCVMKVRHYDFRDLDEEKDKSSLRPLTELKIFVDEFHKARHN